MRSEEVPQLKDNMGMDRRTGPERCKELNSSASLSSSYASTTSLLGHCELGDGDLQAQTLVKHTSGQPKALETHRHEEPVVNPAAPFNPTQYLLWHKRALLQRMRVGNGRSHEMQRLFNFWVSFLQDNFNEPMYEKFKTYAEEDASAGYTHGLTCLFHFYRRYLALHFEAELYQDFEALALKYQDYLSFQEGVDCLFYFLTGSGTLAQHSAAPAAAQSGHCPTSESASPSSAAGSHAGILSLASARSSTERAHSDGSSNGAIHSTDGAGSRGRDVGSSSHAETAGEQLHTELQAGSPTPSFPGLPKTSGVTVDQRVIEQFQFWQVRSQTWQQGPGYSGGRCDADQYDDQHSECNMHASGSVTGSSDTGEAVIGSNDGTCRGKKPHARYRGSWHGHSNLFTGVAYGASPPQSYAPLACSLPVPSTLAAAYPVLHDPIPLVTQTSGGYNGGLKAGSAPNAAFGLPPNARSKRPRHKAGGTRRLGFMPGSSPGGIPNGMLGCSPPLRSHTSIPHGFFKSGNTRGGKAHVSPSAAHLPAAAHKQQQAASAGKPSGASSPASEEPPLWEAQPCGAVLGPSAELAKALPMRLGELFGD